MAKIQRNFIAGKMNKVVDERLLPEGQYVDAMNVRMGSTENSEIGVIENSKGNVALTSLMYIDGTPLSQFARCIGALEDAANETIYWFVHDPSFFPNTQPPGSGKLDLIVSFNVFTGTLTYHVISIKDPLNPANTTLNFNPKYLITGVDIVEDLLFFTDDYNPPRFINVKKGYPNPVGNVDDALLYERLLVIKRPPVEAPVVTPVITSGQENYMEDRFLSFAYRYQYDDGEYSATSQWSDPCFVTSSFSIDLSSYLNNGMKNSTNGAKIDYNTGGPLVKGIDILFKDMDSNVIKVVEKIDKALLGYTDNTIKTYDFSNSKIYTILPESELLRLYDNVPRKAKAQTIMGNRLMYGNYVEGYDLIDKFGFETNISYQTSLSTTPIDFVTLPSSTSNGTFAYVTPPPNPAGTLINQCAVTVNLSSIISQFGKIPSGSLITVDLTFEGVSFAGNNVASLLQHTGATDVSFSFYANQDYATVFDMVNSTEFQNAVGQPSQIYPVYSAIPGNPISPDGNTWTDQFNASIQNQLPTTTLIGSVTKYVSLYNGGSPPTALASPIGNPISVIASGNTFIVQLLSMLFADDLSVNPSPQIIAEYYSIVSHEASFQNISNARSLHSNRGYEIGIVYMDEYGRSSTVLVSRNNTEHVPCGYSTNKNSIFVTIPSSSNIQRAPEWATRFKFVCRADKENYETIYSFIYFYDEDEGEAYFLLEGENTRKVEVGDKLIVKADSRGPLTSCVYTTVLEKEAKQAGFIQNAPAGVYIKLKPDNFSTIKDPSSYVDLGTVVTIENNSGDCPVQNYPVTIEDPSNPPLHLDIDIPAGSVVYIDINFERVGTGDGGNKCEKRKYTLNLKVRASRDYSSFRDFFIGENVEDLLDSGIEDLGAGGVVNNIFIASDGILTNCQSGTNYYQFRPANVNNQKYLQISGTVACGKSPKRESKISSRIQIFKAQDTCVFETMPSDTIPDVFFENNISYPIDSDGNHLANAGGPATDVSQNISGGVDGFFDTGFFNCYTFGNGIESYKYMDSIVGRTMNLGNRVNSVSAQDYKESDRFADITYSGVYNPETNVNKLNEFNLGLLNYKNLEISFGEIFILDGRQTDVLTLQEDKISYVLTGKNLLSDATGGGAVTSVPEVLGTQIARPEKYGISFNPESYVQWGYDRFFTDVKRGAVIQLRGDSYQNDQLKVVSEMGMRTWFRDTFIDSFGKQKLGGFDPYMNEYVLSGNNIDLPQDIPCIDCGTTQTLSLFSAQKDSFKQFCVNLGIYIGQATINYNFVAFNPDQGNSPSASITVLYNGNTYFSGPISNPGPGSFSFPKNSNIVNTATVTINYPQGSFLLMITADCPVREELTIIEVVYTNISDAGETIHPEFYYYNPSYTAPVQSNLVTFLSSPSNPVISRYNVTTGFVGSPGFPAAGDTMRLRTNKISPDTFSFDPTKNKFMYLRTNTLYNNNLVDMIALRTAAINSTPVFQPSANVFYSNFTVPPSLSGNILYLIWDLRSYEEKVLCYYDDESYQGNQPFSNNNLCCECDLCTSQCISLYLKNFSSVNEATIVFPSGRCGLPYEEIEIKLDPEEETTLCFLNSNDWYIEEGDAQISIAQCDCFEECISECAMWTLWNISNNTSNDASYTYTNCNGQSISGVLPWNRWVDVCTPIGSGSPIVTEGEATWVKTSECGCCALFGCWHVLVQTLNVPVIVEYYDCNDDFQTLNIPADSSSAICVSKRLSFPRPIFSWNESVQPNPPVLTFLNGCNCQSVVGG